MQSKRRWILGGSVALVALMGMSWRSGAPSTTTVVSNAVDVRSANSEFAPGPVALGALQTAVFAGGCFWGVEAVFEHVRGVTSVVSGYAGGKVVNPDYGSVSSGRTGHAEAVRVVFDTTVVSYETLLKVFFTVAHDPTELNRQGPDVGTQYRSAIFALNAAQQAASQALVASMTAAHQYKRPIVTQITPLDKFYEAEAYHQNYLVGHMTQPYIVYNDLPKLDALKKVFPLLWSDKAAQ